MQRYQVKESEAKMNKIWDLDNRLMFIFPHQVHVWGGDKNILMEIIKVHYSPRLSIYHWKHTICVKCVFSIIIVCIKKRLINCRSNGCYFN